jgi:hypothetical protein
MITPPFFRGIEQHTVTKDPMLELALIQSIFFNKHLGETAFFKIQGFYGV